MKTIVSNEEVAELWAKQTQPKARNATRSFYFDGPTIYSYGEHFPVATWIRNKAGTQAVVMTSNSYSMTTAKHIGTVSHAIYKLDPDLARGIFRLPLDSDLVEELYVGHLPTRTKGAIINCYSQDISEAIVKAEHAHTNWKKKHYYTQAQDREQEGNRLMQFLGLPDRIDKLPADMPRRLALSSLDEILGTN